MFANYHTHTVFCDGKNTAEELVLEAIRLGCPEIGFSGHSYLEAGSDWSMSPENTERYKEEILRLREKYRGRIKILLGVEQDYYSDAPTDGYDYVIGSVHYVKKNGDYLSIDKSCDDQTESVNKYYGGDFFAFAEDYYKTVSDVYNKTKCDVIGHFDLITKFNEGDSLFDTRSPRYTAAAFSALKSLCKSPVAFEINFGAIARGYRTEPYPQKDMIDYIKKSGNRTMFSSDCHDAAKLMFGYELYEGTYK